MPQNAEANNYGVKLSTLAKQARNLVRDLDPSVSVVTKDLRMI
jgi:hypothetical protein